MGRTLDTATDRDDRPSQAVIDRDLSNSIEIKNAPSGAAMTRLLAVIGYAGPQTLQDKLEITIADIQHGRKHATLADWKRYCGEWNDCKIIIDDQENRKWKIGSLVSFAEVDYSKSGILTLFIEMSTAYKISFEKSDIWALIDIEQASHLNSKYATYLYMKLAGSWNLQYIKEMSMDMDELRHVLKIPKGKLKQKADALKYALKPAVEEISRVTSYNITWEPIKTRRFITGAKIRWERKKPDIKEPIDTGSQGERLAKSVQGRDPDQMDVEDYIGASEASTAKPTSFPKGYIKTEGNEHWYKLAWDHTPRINGKDLPDLERLLDDFKAWAEEKGMDVYHNDINKVEKSFIGFCKKYKQR